MDSESDVRFGQLQAAGAIRSSLALPLPVKDGWCLRPATGLS